MLRGVWALGCSWECVPPGGPAEVAEHPVRRPGVSAPRSVVVTSTLLMLCSENLLEQDVKLTVLDSSSVSDVSKIVAEDADASCVTIIFKSASFGITQRKWRLRLKSTAAASKFLSDIRNVKDM